MKKILFFAFIISSLVANSQSVYKANTASVSFKIKNAGLTVDGSFSGLTATIKFAENNVAKSFIEASVDANSINTGIELRDKHLKKEEFFYTSSHPRISLKSNSFTKEKDGTFKGVFNFTMKGITKEIIIPFTFKESEAGATFKGSFQINRRDFKVGGSSWVMADDVVINFTINCIK